MASGEVPRIVVVGGGFAGLEAALLLSDALGRRAAVTLVTPETSFTMRPDSVYAAFGASPAAMQIPLAPPLARRGIPLVRARVEEIDPARQVLLTPDEEIRYDYAVLATGAAASTERIPGLAQHAVVIWTPADLVEAHRRFAAVRDAARDGARPRVVFAVPPHNDWPAPLYELLLMFESWLWREGARAPVHLSLVTCERGCLSTFGQRTEDLLRRELATRGIFVTERAALSEVRGTGAEFTGAGTVPFDLLVAAAPYRASTAFQTLARDSRGFALVEQESRRALGYENVYVVGDAADFPVKQAVLALLQADAAAESLVARIEQRAPRFTFAPTSVLLLDELDSAIFAQVPLHLGGTPSAPLQVVEAEAPYLLGRSAAWRVGRKVMSRYLAWRLRTGRPFHGGVVWRGMQRGLEWMERAFATRAVESGASGAAGRGS